MAADLEMIEAYDHLLTQLERDIIACAKEHDLRSYALLQTIPGVGRILGLVILYEIESIERFPTVQDFASYGRLVKCIKESNGKKYGSSNKKISNAHLKWAFSEAAVLFLKGNEPGKTYLQRLTRKHGKAKALSILAHKLGRAVYFMLKNKEAFNQKSFSVSKHWRGWSGLPPNWNLSGHEHAPASIRVKKTHASQNAKLMVCQYCPIAHRFDWWSIPLLIIF